MRCYSYIQQNLIFHLQARDLPHGFWFPKLASSLRMKKRQFFWLRREMRTSTPFGNPENRDISPRRHCQKQVYLYKDTQCNGLQNT